MGSRWELMTFVRVAANVCWVLAGVLLAAGWIVILRDTSDWGVGVMLAATAAFACAVAAVMHVRIYTARMCSLIQSLNAGGGDSASNVRVLN